MKKSLLLLILIMVGVLAIAQPLSKQDLSVQQTIQNFFTALSNGDTAGLRSRSTADVRFYEYGQEWSIDTLIQKVMVVRAADYKRSNKFDFVNTTINGNTAWATYYLQSEITRNGKQELVKWMETVVLVRLKNQWKIELLHSTLIKRT